tara:strand:+ start:746 stop:1069 length:324 start_codon:yes stop_codon:yes gene_type:complete
MYNFNLNFTYNNDDEYQTNLLNCFNLTEYHEKSLSEKMDNLYNYLIKNEDFKNLFKNVANMYMSEDLEIGFAFLFSYTHFKDFHDFISEYNKTGKVNGKMIKQFTAK